MGELDEKEPDQQQFLQLLEQLYQLEPWLVSPVSSVGMVQLFSPLHALLVLLGSGDVAHH